MNEWVRSALVFMAVVVGVLAAYYAAPLGVAVISIGEICPYSPLGTNLCRGSTLCEEPGIRYAGKTEQGAEVCFTLSRDSKKLIETGFSFVRASGCPDGAVGTVSGGYPATSGLAIDTVDPSGHVGTPHGLKAVIRGDMAGGVLENSDICPGKTFKWSAHRKG
jgi:hypothetical protein